MQDLAGCDEDLGLMLSIDRVEMGRWVIREVHRDHDPVERRDPRHRPNVATRYDTNAARAPDF